MSSENWLNMLTGMSQGNFDKLYIKDSNGAVVDILTLLGQGGGGGGGNATQGVTTATLPLAITNGIIYTLFKPTNVNSGVNSGIVLLQNDTLGTLSIECNGSEERSSVKFVDTNSVVRLLTSNTSDNILFNNTILVDMNILAQNLGELCTKFLSY